MKRRAPRADALRRAEVDRERRTRAFLDDGQADGAQVDRDDCEFIDDADELFPLTAIVKGLRAVEEL